MVFLNFERRILMSISIEQVKKIAKLSRLNLSEQELQKYSGQLSSILDHMAVLQEVNVEGIEPMYHACQDAHEWREDEARPFDADLILERSIAIKERAFSVPRIINTEE
jgi:aspartyl-tRNA(Asn)/glutamyl-tRNA(Gln) amidotransferase subunit C